MRTAALAAVIIAASATPADAYEFWLRAQSVGQAYQLRAYRLVGPDLFHGRRRYTQTLALRITDVGDLAAARRRARIPGRGVTIAWHSYLRIDHDFGTYTTGRIPLSTAVRRDAIDAIPELAESAAGLSLLYGHVSVDGLADDRLELKLGRVLADDGWGSLAVDGVTARLELPVPLAVAASAGLRVRAASPLGLAALELDGTSGAGCQEYVEGPTPGGGAWKLIDRNRAIQNSRLSSDYELCPQREVRQPTISVAVSTARTRNFGAEVGYRRTWSQTVGLIDAADRFTYPDRGLYPNEDGQAPTTGVNEERLHARAHAELRAGLTEVAPYVNARVSLLHAAIDRADAGVRFRRGPHVVEPTVEYFLPTFDGDSIFNVFSIEPTTDVRLGYQYEGAVRARASGWVRRYAHDDETASVAGGADLGVERALGARGRTRVGALWDDGYGGRRVGGSGELAWRPRDSLWLRGRLIVLGVRQDDHPAYVNSAAMVSSSYRLAEAVVLHVVAEANQDEVHAFQTRVLGVLDLAFTPEQ